MYFRTNLVGTLSRLRETADHLDNGEPDGEHENRDREPADPLREPDHHVGLMARCLGEPVDALVESFGAATLKLGNRGVPFVGRALGTCMVYEFVISGSFSGLSLAGAVGVRAREEEEIWWDRDRTERVIRGTGIGCAGFADVDHAGRRPGSADAA